uniref:non-specific serine/threonine protein kinase n=1 Tax=Chrysemys picta bellii TaxID=8478 RepID=A0A8C3HVI3_CHRPI
MPPPRPPPAFELATGDYLFEPHSGDEYSRDEGGLHPDTGVDGPGGQQGGGAVMGDRMGGQWGGRAGRMGDRSCEWGGELRHIPNLRPWALGAVLLEKYEWPQEQAAAFARFLLPMLDFLPERRPTAAQCLQHPWLGP